MRTTRVCATGADIAFRTKPRAAQSADNADSARLRDCPSAWAADRRAAVISCGGEQGLRGAQVEARTGSSPAAFARRAMRASNARFLASTSAAKAALLIVFLTRLLF